MHRNDISISPSTKSDYHNTEYNTKNNFKKNLYMCIVLTNSTHAGAHHECQSISIIIICMHFLVQVRK